MRCLGDISDESESEDDEWTGCLNNKDFIESPEPTNLLHISVTLSRVRFIGLIDTGSQATIISETVYRKIGSPPLSTSLPLYGFGNSRVQNLGFFHDSIQLQSCTILTKIYVLKDDLMSVDCIVGMNTLQHTILKFGVHGLQITALDNNTFVRVKNVIEDMSTIDLSHIFIEDTLIKEESSYESVKIDRMDASIQEESPSDAEETDKKNNLIQEGSQAGEIDNKDTLVYEESISEAGEVYKEEPCDVEDRNVMFKDRRTEKPIRSEHVDDLKDTQDVEKCGKEVTQDIHPQGYLLTRKIEAIVSLDHYTTNLRKTVDETSYIPCNLADRRSGRAEGFLHRVPKRAKPLKCCDFRGPLPSVKNYKYRRRKPPT